MAEVSLLLGGCAKVWPARASAVIKIVCMVAVGRRGAKNQLVRIVWISSQAEGVQGLETL